MEKNCNRPDFKATLPGRGPYYGIYMQQKCNSLDARATPSGLALIWYCMKRVMGSRLHNCLSERPQLAFERRIEKTESMSI